MHKFLGGFLAGILLKNKICWLLKTGIANGSRMYHSIHKKKNVKIDKVVQKISFVCALKNHELFKERFPVGKVQPHWEYFSNKNVIKIVLDDDVINYFNFSLEDLNLSLEDVVMMSTLDYKFFKELGDTYLYIDYVLNENKYTNVYNELSTITKINVLNESSLKNNFNDVICASLCYDNKTEYISSYFKSFFNNNDFVKITPNVIMYNYNKINTLNFSLQLINNKSIVEKKPNEELN